METLVKNVKDIEAGDRSVMERIVGHALDDTQRLIIQVASEDCGGSHANSNGKPSTVLPGWCNIYEGLTKAEIDELSSSIVRSTLSRVFP